MLFKNKKTLTILFIGTCLVALSAFLFGLYIDRHIADIDADPVTHFPVFKDDSIGYVALANNIATLHSFTSDGTTPETFRTPGYPLFIDFGELFGGITGVIILQILCLAGTAVLTFFIGERLWGRAVGLASSIVFAISPNALFHTVVVLSDIPFTFFTILSVYLLFFSRRRIRIVALSAISLTAAAYLRPIGLYLPAIFVPFLLYEGNGGREAFVKAIGPSGIFVAILVMLIVPWLVRNRVEAGAFAFSSVGTFNFAYYNVPAFLADRYGSTSSQYVTYENQIGVYPIEYLRSFSTVQKLDVLMAPVLKGNIVRYALFHIESMSIFFLSSSVRYVVEQVEIPSVQNVFGFVSRILPTCFRL